MSKLGDSKSKVFGYISALRTLLDNYPELNLSDDLMDLLASKSPIEFIMKLLKLLGLSTEELLNWISKLLCGEEVLITKLTQTVQNSPQNKTAQGFLDVVETAIKILLLTNVKETYTCTINPFIPNNVLKYPLSAPDNPENNGSINGIGIKIPVSSIDMFNTLSHVPTSLTGKCFYFDVDYPTNELWKSTDFNAFLWYIINKSMYIDNTSRLKTVWDNRVTHRKRFINNEDFKNNFFNLYKCNGSYINLNKEKNPKEEYEINESRVQGKIQKKQYILVEYEEKPLGPALSDYLTIYLNADRYRYPIKDKNGNIINRLNRTVFEFNYDYIFSLKLFDSKTLATQVINSVLQIFKGGINNLINSVSFERQIVAGKVGKIVKEVVEGDKIYINDCSFNFSNNDYDNLLNETEIKYSNGYSFGEVTGDTNNIDVDAITKDLLNLSNCATLEEERTALTTIITNVTEAIAAQNGMISLSDKFSFNANIITELLKELIIEIVMQVLSPKVMVLYTLNSYFMGDIKENDITKINVAQLLASLTNLLVKMVKQLFEMILQELINFLMEIINELIILLLEKLLTERIRFYIELLKNLLALMLMFKSQPKPQSVIDNVNYADIIPPQETPPSDEC